MVKDTGSGTRTACTLLYKNTTGVSAGPGHCRQSLSANTYSLRMRAMSLQTASRMRILADCICRVVPGTTKVTLTWRSPRMGPHVHKCFGSLGRAARDTQRSSSAVCPCQQAPCRDPAGSYNIELQPRAALNPTIRAYLNIQGNLPLQDWVCFAGHVMEPMSSA